MRKAISASNSSEEIFKDAVSPTIISTSKNESDLKRLSTIIHSSRVSATLATPLIELARNAFFHHYVTHDLRTYSYLQTFSSSALSEKQLSTSVDAVSLAFFSHWANLQRALEKAKEAYVSALKLISEAVRCPKTASHDTTLLSALLLDLFEKMTSREPQSAGAWVSHVNGAFSLVQLRGRDQFKRPLGIQLLVRLCNNLLISCVVSHRPAPPDFLLLRAAVAESVDSHDPKWRLGGLMLRFAELRQASKCAFASPRQVLDIAKSLDDDFVALVKDMPPSWQYETISMNSPSHWVYGSSYHVYSSVHVTQTWNVLRLARILIKEIVLEQSSQLPNSSTLSMVLPDIINDHDAVGACVDDLASDICASAPQYTAVHSKNLSTCTNTTNSSSQQNKNQLSTYTLLFPLFVAAQSPTTPPNIRTWIICHLQRMSQDLGIRNAALILSVLERGEWVDPWSIYAMLGGYAFVA